MPCWHLVPREGQAVSSSRIIQTEDGRATLREVLLRSCFSPAARAALAGQAGINAEAYHYSLGLLDQAHRNDDIRNGMPLCKPLLIYSNLYNY